MTDPILLERSLVQGVDLACVPLQGLVWLGDQYQQVTGLEAYLQALTLCLVTEKGSLFDIPEYGYDVQLIVGEGIEPGVTEIRAKSEAYRALSFEAWRIRDIVSIDVRTELNKVYLTVTSIPVGYENPVTIQDLEVARVS